MDVFVKEPAVNDKLLDPSFVKPYLELVQKMGSFASQVNKASIDTIKIVAEGDISEYLESMLTFAIVGALKGSMGEHINYVNAEFVAKEKNIKTITEVTNISSAFKNSIDLYLSTDKGITEVKGTVFGDDVQRIVLVDNNISKDILQELGKLATCLGVSYAVI